MPNTLAHIGLQSIFPGLLAGRRFPADLVLVGCVIPDIPWLLRRIVAALSESVDTYSVFAFASIQASLFFSLILATAVAMIYARPGYALSVIGAGCSVHLLLDATQIKWGNGVLLFAPLNWDLVAFEIVWPDHFTAYTATAIGAIAVCVLIARKDYGFSPIHVTKHRVIAIGGLMLLYAIAPAMLIGSVFNADNHYLQTLRDVNARPGKFIELDRSYVHRVDEVPYAALFSGEDIRLSGFSPESNGLYSLRGTFVSQHEIAISEWQRNSAFRNFASVFGLSLIALLLLTMSWRQYMSADSQLVGSANKN